MTKKRITEDGEIVDAPEMGRYEHIAAFFKTPHNHNTELEALRTGTVNNEPTLTQQNTQDEVDINKIIKRFGIGGARELAKMPPTFMDVPEMDMQKALDMVHEAEESFLQLPAETRAQFNNDLARYVGHVDDRLKANDLEALDTLGLDVKEALGAKRAAKAAREAKEEADFQARVAKATKKD